MHYMPWIRPPVAQVTPFLWCVLSGVYERRYTKVRSYDTHVLREMRVGDKAEE